MHINNLKSNVLTHQVSELTDKAFSISPVTYNELVELRDKKLLIPKNIYRLIDYECTTTQKNTRAKHNKFDILITAISSNTLSEECKVIRPSNLNPYFFSSHLESWKVWYCLDNDVKRFGWANNGINTMDSVFSNGTPLRRIPSFDNAHSYAASMGYYYAWGTAADVEDTDCVNFIYSKAEYPKPGDKVYNANNSEEQIVPAGGKGVIYRMIDEHRNDIAYDFKNIQFKRWKGTDITENHILGDLDNTYCIADIDNLPEGMTYVDSEEYVWLYTFSLHTNSMDATDIDSDTEIFDETVFIEENRVMDDEHLGIECRDNTIKALYGEINENSDNIIAQGQTQFLNNNTFLEGCFEGTGGNYYNDISYNIRGNKFGINCYNNSIGSGFQNNSIEYYFHNNSIGNSFYCNSVRSGFQNNSIGNDFRYNSIGSDFYDNSIGSYFYSNSIGSTFYRNSIESSFQDNSIGNYFNNNFVGNTCWSNSIGNHFYNNSIENYNRYITINNGVHHILLTNNTGLYIQNAHIYNGVHGNSSNILTIAFTADVAYTQFAALQSDGTLKIWTA